MKVSMYRSVLGRDGYVSIVAQEGKYVCDGRKQFCDPDTVVEFCRTQLEIDTLPEESVFVFALNNKLHLQGMFEASRGSNNSCMMPVREIFQKLLCLNANTFIVVHNHPSGDPTPSGEDRATTKQLKTAGEILGITLADHIVIGNYAGYYSFNAER